jgi:hypothetical protein
MAGKALNPELLELRGSYVRHPERRPTKDQAAPVVRLAEERIEVAEPAPDTVTHPRGVALWEELVKRMAAQSTMTRDALRVLERYVILNCSMWRQAEARRPIRAAVTREISALELQLGLAKPQPGTPTPKAAAAKAAQANPNNPFNRFEEELPFPAIGSDAWHAWQRECRQAAADALQLFEQLRRRRRKTKPRKASAHD